MTRTEHDCRWRLLDAYIAWCATRLHLEAPPVVCVWAFYLALGLRAPLPWGPVPPEDPP
jgi:hypothetical protein